MPSQVFQLELQCEMFCEVNTKFTACFIHIHIQIK